jgi:cobalamin biosynthesis protein CobT
MGEARSECLSGEHCAINPHAQRLLTAAKVMPNKGIAAAAEGKKPEAATAAAVPGKKKKEAAKAPAKKKDGNKEASRYMQAKMAYFAELPASCLCTVL